MAGKNKIVIQQATNKQKYVLIKSANNKVVAQTETYKTNQGVGNAVDALRRIVKNATIIDKTKK